MYYILYSICCISSVVSNSFQPHGLHSPWNSPGQNAGVDNHSILQGIFPTQGSNPGLRHCRRVRFQLSHKGSLRILEWVAYPFSSRSSRPRNLTRVSCIAGRFFTSWATREAHIVSKEYFYWFTIEQAFNKDILCMGFPGGASGKESDACHCRRHKRWGFDPWVGKIPRRRIWQPTPVFLPGKIPWTEEPGGLPSMGSQRVGHDWLSTHTHTVYNH